MSIFLSANPANERELLLEEQVQQLKAEIKSLQKVQKDFHEIIEHATEIIFKLDEQGYFYFVSREFERTLSFSNEEMQGVHFTTILHPEDVAVCVETIQYLREHGRAPNSIDFRVCSKEGSYKWVSCSAICVFDNSHAPTHIIGMAHEITQLKLLVEELGMSENALRLSEERYRSLFQALSEGAMLVHKNGTIIACNRSAQNILGITEEQLANLNTQEAAGMYYKEDGTICPKSEHPDTITFRTGRSIKNQVLGIAREHGILWISINTEPIYYSDSRESPDAVIASFRDITQLRRDRAELAYHQQLLMQEKDHRMNATRVIAEAVVDAQEKERAEIGVELHDNVNQILSTARLYLDLAAINEADRVNLIKKSASGLANAVNELRRISHSLVPSTLNDVGLTASVDDLVDSLQISGVDVKFYHSGVVDEIGDKSRLVLFRIIQEQITNVLKHSGATKLVIELMAEPTLISLTLTDNGKGTDPGSFRQHKGLGLYNITNRAELLNGKVSIETSPGNGFKLNISIPVIN